MEITLKDLEKLGKFEIWESSSNVRSHSNNLVVAYYFGRNEFFIITKGRRRNYLFNGYLSVNSWFDKHPRDAKLRWNIQLSTQNIYNASRYILRAHYAKLGKTFITDKIKDEIVAGELWGKRKRQ